MAIANTNLEDESKIKRKDSPVPLDIPLGKCALTIRSNCGQCLHLKRMAYPSYKIPCIDRGIIEESKPCAAFNPNPQQIKFTQEKHARNIALAIQELNPRELKLLAAIFNREERTRKKGFRFGQIVYFKVFGSDYISNYVKARIISADSKYVHLEGSDGSLATLYHESVLNKKQWDKKELDLLKRNKINDPKRASYFKVTTKKDRNIKSILDKTLPNDLNAKTEGKGTILSHSEFKKNTRTMPLDQLLIIR